MLQQKRTMSLSLYHLRKSLRFSNERNFHFTYCSFLRKIASARKHPGIDSVAEEKNIAGEFQAQTPKEICKNFYGIENDEGVIYITENPRPSEAVQDSFINKFSLKTIPEKFKSTRFGKIRLDRENKLIFHGQYEDSTSDFDMDKMSRKGNLKIESVNKNSSSSTEQSPMSISFNSPECQEIKTKFPLPSKFDNIGNQLEHRTPGLGVEKVVQNFTTTDQTDGSSFIDELCFPDEYVADEDVTFTSKNKNFGVGRITNKCKSVPEEPVVSTREENPLYNSESFISKKFESRSEEGNMKFKSEDENLQDENLEYMKDIRNKHSNDLIRLKVETQVQHHTSAIDVEIRQKSEATEIRYGSSFIDEICFPDEYVSNKDKDMEFATENKDIYCNIETHVDHKNLEYIAEKDFMDQPKYKDMQKCKINTTNLDTPSLEQKLFIDNSFGELDKFNSDFTSNITYPTQKNNFLLHNELEEELSNSKLSPKSISQSSLSERDLDRNIRNFNQQKPKILKVSENVENASGSDQKLNQGQAETALDFVKKLRGEKKVTRHELISGISRAPKEMLDSKGFRILKNQVPTLKYFTRDEILDLLVKNVLYSDDDIVILNKPYNLVIHESKTTKDACLSTYLDDLAAELDKRNKNPKLLTVHRLDKETTGCLLLARNEASAQRLKSLFAQRKITKTYWIVTTKVPDPLAGIINIPIAEGFIDKKSRMVLHPELPKDIRYKNHCKGGKRAVTHYNVIAESGNAALVEVKLETGLKHQIRVHFGFGLSCPILGDHKYTYLDKLVPQKLSTDLLQKLHVRQSKVRHIPLHIYARSIFIPQYSEGRNLFVMAPLPIHMSKNLQRLKFKKNKS